jgi:FMN-dependent NADH-azoreductase
MRLLHIDSGIQGESSVSRQLSAELALAWCAAFVDVEVSYVDLTRTLPTHFGQDSLSLKLHVEAASEDQRKENALSERLLDQFLSADVIIIGAPLYNYGVPSQLKTWIDRITVSGRTFRYGKDGRPVGLAGDKIVIVVSVRGGVYTGSECSPSLEPQERTFLRQMFGFFGIEKIHFICAEGTAKGEEAKAEAISTARGQIDLLVLSFERNRRSSEFLVGLSVSNGSA